MDLLKCYSEPDYLSDFDGPVGSFGKEVLDGYNGTFHHYAANNGGWIMNFYCCRMSGGKSAIFFYMSEDFSDMIKDIVRNLDRFNRPSVKKIWPHFYRALENGENDLDNKISLRRISHYNDSSENYYVVMFRRNGYVDFDDVGAYHSLLQKMLNFTDKLVKEVTDDNGCLPLKEMINCFGRGAKEANMINLFGNLI